MLILKENNTTHEITNFILTGKVGGKIMNRIQAWVDTQDTKMSALAGVDLTDEQANMLPVMQELMRDPEAKAVLESYQSLMAQSTNDALSDEEKNSLQTQLQEIEKKLQVLATFKMMDSNPDYSEKLNTSDQALELQFEIIELFLENKGFEKRLADYFTPGNFIDLLKGISHEKENRMSLAPLKFIQSLKSNVENDT